FAFLKMTLNNHLFQHGKKQDDLVDRTCRTIKYAANKSIAARAGQDVVIFGCSLSRPDIG
ncbi:MAG: hypothetical protein LH615_03415, partial [Ferruginibacter sp.]|nr:hypothetical protein [Ferruginibacter sp.]